MSVKASVSSSDQQDSFPQKTLRVLAIFFGGQDHQRHMLKRLASGLTSG